MTKKGGTTWEITLVLGNMPGTGVFYLYSGKRVSKKILYKRRIEYENFDFRKDS